MTRAVSIRNMMAVPCTQCQTCAEWAYVIEGEGGLEVYDCRCESHEIQLEENEDANSGSAIDL